MKNWRMAWAVWALGFAAIGGCAGKGSPKPVAAGEPVVFHVTGMHCDGCAAAVAKAVEKVPGVQSAKVSFDDKQAVVVPDKGEFDPETVLTTIKELGYEAKLARSGDQ